MLRYIVNYVRSRRLANDNAPAVLTPESVRDTLLHAIRECNAFDEARTAKHLKVGDRRPDIVKSTRYLGVLNTGGFDASLHQRIR